MHESIRPAGRPAGADQLRVPHDGPDREAWNEADALVAGLAIGHGRLLEGWQWDVIRNEWRSRTVAGDPERDLVLG